MKRTCLTLCSIIVSIFALANAAQANVEVPERQNKWEAGLDFYSIIPNENKVDNSLNLGGHVDYGLFDNLALGFSIGWQDPDLSATLGDGTEAPVGSLTMIPVFADFIFRERPGHYDNLYSFYAVIGVGGTFVSHDDDSILATNNLRAVVNDSFALKFGLGMEYYVNKNWILFLEGGFVATGSEIEYVNRVNGASIDTKDLDYWYLGGGAKYLFQ